jgi:hypothetical protein
VAGKNVFGQIFETYCKPGGALRDFNVSEITSEAVFFRSGFISECQRNEWKVDDWVKNIPVLP